MQAAGNGGAQRLRAALAATGIALLALDGPVRAEPETTLVRRAISIGVSDDVRARAARSISPHLGKLRLDGFESAEVAAPPPPCGVRVYRRFGRAVREHFQVATLGACQISPTRVDCPTEYLADYRRVYLVLTYQNVPAREMSVAVDARRRGSEGHVSPGSGALTREHKLKLADTFDSVFEEAMCEDRGG
jgi:hypothetical protein